MKDIKEVIAKNLSTLRKKNNLTQNELAEKLNYSDNAVSRWEHGEVTPSIETLQQIANIYSVSLSSLIEDDAQKVVDTSYRRKTANELAILLISTSLIWFVATIIFVGAQLIWNKTLWQLFVWSLPIVSLVLLPFHHYWGRHIYKFIVLTVFVWTLLCAIFLQFYSLSSWMWMVFIVGIPIEVALAIWAFVKPKPPKPKKEKKSTANKNKE